MGVMSTFFCNKKSARRRLILSRFAEYIAHEIRQLLSPPWPVMVYIVAPVICPVRNALVLKGLVELLQVDSHLIFPCALSRAEDYAALSVEIHPRVVLRHVRDKLDRRICVCEIILI